MKYKKKKGSTLLVVVCLCAFLSILTLSIMLVTTGGFKLRKDENTRVENFYNADSGIEIAKNKMIEVIESAIKSGETVIADMADHPEKHPHIDFSKDDWEQKPFKLEFERYIDEKLEKEIDNTALKDGSTPTSVIYDEFKKNELVIKVDAVDGDRYQNGSILDPSKSDYSKGSKRYQEWELTSNFKDKDSKDREVKVNYKVKTPDYGKTSGQAVPNMSIFDYIMGIDGNLDINNNGTFSSIGHMWIGGENESGDRNMDFANYKPGIKLHANSGTKGANFKWDGNVVTPTDIFIEDANFQADNLFADDFLYKGEDHKLLFNKDVYVNNDFIFDAEKTTMTVQNYYGLDDVDEKLKPEDKDIVTDPKNLGKSSAIIVNSSDFGTGSKINIQKDSYILGTAHIRLDGVDYKTGESISINKITEPYTSRRIGEEFGNVELYQYKYLNPLQIVDKKFEGNDYRNLTVTEKHDIVMKHLGANTLSSIFGGLNIEGTSYSSGVVYDNKEALSFNNPKKCLETHDHRGRDRTTDECKRREFSQEAYNMGGTLSYEEAEYAFKNKERQVGVAESFNWKFIRDNMMTEETLKKEDGTPIFDRVHAYPASATAAKDVVIFESRQKVGEIITDLPENYFLDSKMTIIFNSSERGSDGQPRNPKDLHFKKDVTGIKDAGRNQIHLPLSYINDPKNLTIVISDGDINIVQPFGASWEVRGMFYSSEDLNLGVGATMTFGNFSVPKFHDINDIFKKLFGGVIGGVVEGGIIDQGNGEHVINPPDLLEQEDWNLIK